MSPEQLDRILRAEARLEPSLGFAERVMRAVRSEAVEREALGFPWRRVAPGLGACALVVLAAFVLGQSPVPEWVPQAPSLRVARTTVWLAATLLGSWAAVWWSLRAAGYSR